jgi:DNA-binding GntR family transcriptional regulator
MRDRTPPLLSRPEYKAKAELVYEEIRRAIQEGALKPGDRLIAEELAAQLHVSRMPVREAIQRLQLEGLVDMIPYKGATVAMVTPEQVKQLFSVRAVLEGLASREAAGMATAEDVARLEAMYREMERAVQEGDTAGQLARNREIHVILWQITRNSLLQSMAANLFDSIERYRFHLMKQPSIPEGSLAEHRAIIDAIAARDPELAEKLTRRHIESTGRLMADYAEGSARPDDDHPSPKEGER